MHNLSVKPQIFGDHKLVLLELCLKSHNNIKSLTIPNWKSYNTETLYTKLNGQPGSLGNFENMSVQEHWNAIEKS